MTYHITIRDDDTWTLTDGAGNQIDSGSLPVKTPDDIIDSLLDEMGVGNPQKEVFKILFKRDWEINDQR